MCSREVSRDLIEVMEREWGAAKEDIRQIRPGNRLGSSCCSSRCWGLLGKIAGDRFFWRGKGLVGLVCNREEGREAHQPPTDCVSPGECGASGRDADCGC